VFDNIEIAPVEVVKRAARDFAAALTETPQFKSFEAVAERFRDDPLAKKALAAYEEKQIAWRALSMLNALSDEQKAELEASRVAFVDQPIVQEYFSAQTEMAALCQELGDRLSESIGLNYASSCGVSCCG
jgi:cell fate (sporulation/competence/biofilm development) regulator YlbF (YheA/YmcA/DUF963 family)